MLTDLKFRLRALFNRAAMDRELSDEVRFHIERETEKLVAGGLPLDEAKRRALVAFGGIDHITEAARDSRGVNLVETMRQDLRYAWRGIVAKPGFAMAIILALALVMAGRALIALIVFLFGITVIG